MPPAAIFDKRRLQRGLYTDDLGKVDVALELPFGSGLNVKVVESLAVQNHDAGFLRVGCVDQHALRHCGRNSGAPAQTGP